MSSEGRFLKRIFHRASYNVGVATAKRDPLLPPGDLHSVGGGDSEVFKAVGDEFLQFFVEFAHLEPDESVLDIGCGTGRIARPLSSYLRRGRYDGIDIVRPAIAWCQKTYSPRFPNFRFHFLDAFNGSYNTDGKVMASEYRFPFGDASFDFIFLTSVFTHMLPADLENYAHEVSRMLKPGGRSLITYFLLNSDSRELIREGNAELTFDYERPGYQYQHQSIPEAAVAYDEQDIRAIYTECGLKVTEPIRYGSWSGRSDGLSFQDVVLARKPDISE